MRLENETAELLVSNNEVKEREVEKSEILVMSASIIENEKGVKEAGRVK